MARCKWCGHAIAKLQDRMAVEPMPDHLATWVYDLPGALEVTCEDSPSSQVHEPARMVVVSEIIGPDFGMVPGERPMCQWREPHDEHERCARYAAYEVGTVPTGAAVCHVHLHPRLRGMIYDDWSSADSPYDDE